MLRLSPNNKLKGRVSRSRDLGKNAPRFWASHRDMEPLEIFGNVQKSSEHFGECLEVIGKFLEIQVQ